MGWKDVARRSIIGERREVKSLIPDEETLAQWKEEGRPLFYWVRPRKYSVAGKDRVDAVTQKNASQIPSDVKLRITALMDEGCPEDEVFKRLSDEDKAKIMDVQLGGTNSAELVTTIIEEGLADSNLIEEGEKIADFAEAVVEFSEMSAEITSIIREYNTPLAEGTKRKSGS